jgi:hypothetical protein
VIVVRLQGRLGNQMFEYAVGRTLAERHGTELVLDSSWVVDGAGGGTMRYELGCFDLDVQVRPVWEVARVPNPSGFVYALQRLRPSRRRFLHVVAEEASNAFTPAVASAPDDAYLLGYWQFEEYFAEREALVREAFSFPALSAASAEIAEEIGRSTAVSVHVRRGDYTEHAHLGGLEASYYERAAETIADAVGDIRLFVFSDEPAWCAEALRFPYETTIVERPLPVEREWEDMRLMSLCRHHVIANSTYGWWGAWLNPSSDKLVVAPRRWSRTEKREGDPIPDRWLRV